MKTLIVNTFTNKETFTKNFTKEQLLTLFKVNHGLSSNKKAVNLYKRVKRELQASDCKSFPIHLMFYTVD